ncbi:MAG TPA: prepilin-type N-terminal cleavage/methylation domain-containing protein [Candidatus Peribacteria bacterium]|nr:prepilin-type N-terminal cleavage/methylation domain-containing protein [Candidatus Peribacteria bacterium]
MPTRSTRGGFTLIELLLVIGIIAILAAIVIVAINPTKQLGDARNAQRRSDVNTILNAVYQYSIDHNGNLPSTITSVTTPVCKSGVNVDCVTDGYVNLNMLTGSYIVGLPNDPQSATATSTNYTIVKVNNRVTVAAPGAEQGASIAVTR